MIFVLQCFFALTEASSFEAHIALTNAPYGVEFSLRNTENQPITILILGTPLEPPCQGNALCTDMFTIISDPNVTATYIGIQRKRAYPPSAFKTLQPNQVVAAQVNLSYGYWFPQSGTYRVTLKASLFVYKGQSTDLSRFTLENLPSDDLFLSVLNPPPLPDFLKPSNGTKDNIAKFIGCNATTKRDLEGIYGPTLQTATAAYNYLASGQCYERPDYVTWFGVCNVQRYETVKQNLLNIINTIRAGKFSVSCDSNCDDWTIAWVWTTIHVIHLCPLFFQYPTKPCESDSQVGTIIHETSHWEDVAGTDDLCYWDTDCKKMARLSPKNATRNADSYALFSTSCPKMPFTVTFATYSSSKIGMVGSLAKTLTPQTFDISCKTGPLQKLVKCTPTIVTLPALNGPSYSFAPSSTTVQGTRTLATSRISLTLTNPNTSPTLSLYLYIYEWPKGTYLFLKNGVSIVSGMSATTKLQGMKLIIGGATWSGIIKIPNNTPLNWVGTSKNSQAFLTFTLAWVSK